MLERWSLEYSEWSHKRGLFPWHISHLDEAIRRNLDDFRHRNRGPNKWQIVYIGHSIADCDRRMNELIAQYPVTIQYLLTADAFSVTLENEPVQR